MHFHTTNYLKDSDHRRHMVHRGFWLRGTPRLILGCRLFGHRPVVDGTAGFREGDLGRRWVCCDRCGVRPEPQGNLDPTAWDVGQPYDGLIQAPRVLSPTVLKQLARRGHKPTAQAVPGLWPAKPTGTLGGELVIGHPYSTGFSIKVGNCASEHTLAADIGLWPLGTLYLHTERHGQEIQRRLNPIGYESRVTEVAISDRTLRTKLWAKRNEWSKTDPWWMRGSFRVDPRDIILGEVRNSWEDVGDPVTGTVRMPEGDEHDVQLTLQKWTTARSKHPFRKKIWWRVDWSSKAGIPFRMRGRGDEVNSATVDVTFDAVRNGRWAPEACAAIAADVSRYRARYNYRPEPAAAELAPDRT